MRIQPSNISFNSSYYNYNDSNGDYHRKYRDFQGMHTYWDYVAKNIIWNIKQRMVYMTVLMHIKTVIILQIC